jgi:hypothetical protein
MATSPKSETVPVVLPAEVSGPLKQAAKAAGLSVSAFSCMLLKHGLEVWLRDKPLHSADSVPGGGNRAR